MTGKTECDTLLKAYYLKKKKAYYFKCINMYNPGISVP